MLSGIDAEARKHLCNLCLGDHFINLIQSLYALSSLVFRGKLPLVAATLYFRLHTADKYSSGDRYLTKSVGSGGDSLSVEALLSYLFVSLLEN
jgi:hypothetical protein